MKIKKFFIFTHSLLFLIFFIGIIRPNFFYWSLLLINLVLFFIFYRIIKLRNNKELLKYLLLPILFINSCFFYCSLLSSRFLSIGFIFIAVLMLYYYNKSSIKYCFIESDKKKNLPLWSNLFGFLTVFLGSAFIYSLPYFIKINNWVLIIFLIIILFLPFFQNIYIEKVSNKTNLFFSFLFLFSLSPLAWSIFLLPFNYNFLALILSLVYYMSLSFVIFYLKKELTLKKIKYNLFFLFFILLLIFFGVNWK